MTASSSAFRALAEQDYRLLYHVSQAEVTESLWWAGKFLQSWHTQVALQFGLSMEFKLEFHSVEGIPSEDVAGYTGHVMRSFENVVPELPLYSPGTPAQSVFIVYELLKSRLQHVADILNISYEEAAYSLFEAYRNFAAETAHKKFVELRGEAEAEHSDDTFEPVEKVS